MNKTKWLVDIDQFRVKVDERVDLKKTATRCELKLDRDRIVKELFPQVIERIQELQEKLYAQNTYGLVIALQAMDAAGKDGTVKHVFSKINPAGVKVVSFKQPSAEENDHDYLWRINKNLPERGMIGIFNRSHYEEVAVTRVHELLKGSQLPEQLAQAGVWSRRFRQIADWERYLAENGFPMVKIFLHVSKKEQQKRLIERIVREEKNWKFSMSDIAEREYWDEYQKDYSDAIEKTTSDEAPWYVVPADDKWFTRYVVALITLDALEKINPQFPEPSADMKVQIERLKALLLEEGAKPDIDAVRKKLSEKKE